MRELGLGCLYLAFFATVFAAVTNTRAVVRLVRGSKPAKGKAEAPLNLHAPRLAMLFAAVCLVTACAAMIHCIWLHRFDLGYVYAYTDRKLAKPFRISALWNGQEGTYLLWAVYLSLWGLLIIGRRNVLATLFPVAGKIAPPLTPLREPFASAVHNWVLVAMMLLLLVRSPFHFIGPKEKWKALEPVLEMIAQGDETHRLAIRRQFPDDFKGFLAEHGLRLDIDRQGITDLAVIETKWQTMTRLAGWSGQPHPKLIPDDGNGMNELLQNPWMCIHPVVMFVGFSAMALPFIFAIAGLIKRDYDGWIHEAFPFVLFPWAFLGTGLTLGGAWAYGVLGWHGYWAWDPVENASLFPWLIATALIHGMVLQRRGGGDGGGGFGRANFSLAILAYLLVLYGTFLTRSGILSDASVHSFTSEGNELYWTLVLVGGVAVMVSYGITPLLPMLSILFLLNRSGFAAKAAKGEVPKDAVGELVFQVGLGIVLGLLACVTVWCLLCKWVTRKWPARRMILFGLLGDRWSQIRARAEYENTASRDFLVFLGVIAIVASATIVTLGTSSPIVMTLLQMKSTQIKQVYEGMVQKSFYNYAHMPIGLTMMLTLGLWRYFPWSGGDSSRLRKHLPRHIAVALLITGTLRLYLEFLGARTGAEPLISALQWTVIAFAALALVANADLGWSVLRRVPWRSGAFVAHMGVAMLFVGTILSSAYEETDKLSLPEGREVKGLDGEFMFKLISGNVNARPGDTRYLWDRDYLVIEYWRNHGAPRRVRRAYPIVSLNNHGEMINVPFIRKQAMWDFYFAAGGQQTDSRAWVEATISEDALKRAEDSKDDAPFVPVADSEPARFGVLPDHRFRLKGYRIFKAEFEKTKEQWVALVFEVERRQQPRTELVARFQLHPRTPRPEPIRVPDTEYFLLVDTRSENEGATTYGLTLTSGSQWLKNLDEPDLVTTENTAEFPALPGWKFILQDRILPEGMTEGKMPGPDAAIRLMIEARHEGKTYELQPGQTLQDQRLIRIPVPGTEYLLTLDSLDVPNRKYLVGLVHEDMKPYWIVEVTHKPMINFVWLGVGVMVLGGLMSLRHRTRGHVNTATE